MNWDNFVLGFLVLLVMGVVGYVLISGEQFLGSDETNPDNMLNSQTSALDNKTNLPEKLPVLAKAPELAGIVDWINTNPVTLKELRGKVVLIDFWTYSCINCIRTYPFVQEWHEKYKDKGLVLLGVHSPEFEFEKNKSNVERAAKDNGLTYPIALDNNMATWNAFANRFWPAHYLIDVDGNIRYLHFGEGKYAETDQAIYSLLKEAGLIEAAETSETVADDGDIKISAYPRTPEIYFGYKRLEHIGGASEIVPNQPREFSKAATVELNKFYLAGEWLIGPESAKFTGETGSISIQYQGKSVNMVLSAESEMKVEIRLDDQPLTTENKGKDIFIENGRSYVLVGDATLYELVSSEIPDTHRLEIIADKAGLEAFTFTFG